QADADQDVMIQAEIDLAGFLRAGPMLERGLELDASGTMVADEVERSSQYGLRQGHAGRLFDDSGDGSAEPCVVQRGLEVTIAGMKHRQHAEQPDLVEHVAACLGNR